MSFRKAKLAPNPGKFVGRHKLDILILFAQTFLPEQNMKATRELAECSMKV